MAKSIKIPMHKRAGKTVRQHTRQVKGVRKNVSGKAGKEINSKKEDLALSKRLKLVDKLANTIYDIGAGSGIMNSPEYDMNRNVSALSQP